MGCSSSRIDKSEVMRLCKERRRLIKQAMDSRYALSAAHLCYIESLRSIGIALRRFAEAEILIESSLSTSVTEIDKSPSNSSLPSPSSPQHDNNNNAETSDSPLHNESPSSPSLSTISYMRLDRNPAVTVKFDPNLNSFAENESLTFHPPPPPPEMDSSWDFFQPNETESFRFVRENGLDHNFENVNEKWEKFSLKSNEKNEIHLESKGHESEKRVHEFAVNTSIRSKGSSDQLPNSEILPRFDNDSERDREDDDKLIKADSIRNGEGEILVGSTGLDHSISRREAIPTDNDFSLEREDPSEFITHRAKDFLSSIKDIEHKFFRASESGKEVSKLLEGNKIRIDYCESKGRSPASVFLAAVHLACCRGESVLPPSGPPQNMTKVITWNRSTSSQSSSSKNPLAPAFKDDVDDSGSDFLEEFCMIAGSHSSTLERLYAWERKLYDEVKASEFIRKEYERKCNQLKHLFARDASPYVIDKTRAVVKDLHSRIRVALNAIDSIAKRIEILRDEELQPQLAELVRGLIRMWKAMLECHHTQYITISLAYHVKSSTKASTQGEFYKQAVSCLQHELEFFNSSFTDWISAYKSYIEDLNGWLQNCIILPQERSRGRRSFSPRRALAPPIFVLARDWSVGIRNLPLEELKEAMKAFVTELQSSVPQNVDGYQKKQELLHSENNGEVENREEDEKCVKSSNLNNIHKSLTKALDGLTKFAEASVKMYVDIWQGIETAKNAYENCRTSR